MSTRVYLLAKRLGIESRRLIEILRTKGFDVSSASSSVADIYAEDLLREFGKSSTAPENAASEAVPHEVEARIDELAAGVEVREAVAAVPVPPQSRLDAAQHSASAERAVPILGRAQTQATSQEPRRMIPLDRIQQPSRAGGNKFGLRGGGDRRQFGGGNFAGGGRFGGNNDQRSGQHFPVHPSSGRNFGQQQQGERRQFSPGFSRNGGERRSGSPSGDFRAPPKPQQLDRRRVGFTTPQAANRTQTFQQPKAWTAPAQTVSTNAADVKNGKVLRLKFPICVRELAPEIGLKPFQLISELMQLGIFASMNYLIDEAMAKRIGEKLSIAIEALQERVPQVTTQRSAATQPEREAILEPRPPVVCVLGHVDHGKTTLLDRIRRANVAAGEAGGITQHIGAYEIEASGGKITFIDTPGHAAFSKMRERGANLTDIAIIVVAADDGFMPQTDEALKFVQRASVPVVVAVNKIDAKGANRERVRQQMQQRGIAAEDWGGETLCCDISAINGDGVDRLLELVLIQAEMLALKADSHCPAGGIVLESQVEIGRGSTASVIISNGTLKVGDALTCGSNYCKVRAIVDDRGKQIKEAPPSKPVKIIGWSGPLQSGATFSAVANEKVARELAELAHISEGRGDNSQPAAPTQRRRAPSADAGDLDALFAAIDAKQKRVLRIIIKGDVHGSVEALSTCLSALPQDKIGLEILRSEVGPVSLGDVEFARPVGATIVAFNVKLENGVQSALKQHGIAIIQHNVIYMLIDSVRESMADLLEPELQEEKLGGAQVRRVFSLSRGTIAGCMVTEGKVLRDAKVRVWRDGLQLFDGKISSLRREKSDVQEVRAGYECGISIAAYECYEVGDIIECYKVNRIRQCL